MVALHLPDMSVTNLTTNPLSPQMLVDTTVSPS